MTKSNEMETSYDLKEVNICFPKDLDKLSKAINKYSFLSSEVRTTNLDTVASILEDKEVLETLIVYLNTQDTENPANLYFMINLLSDVIEENKIVANNTAKLEELKDEKLSFNKLKAKSQKLRALLIPNSTFFKMLVAHKEWLKVIK